jgi:hypothetical protein
MPLTELEQLETDRNFSSLRKFLQNTKNLDEADRKLGGLSIKQVRLFAQYYQRKKESRQKLETRIRRAPRNAAEIRYGKIHPSHKIGKTKAGRIFIRNTKGRFVEIPRYLKRAIVGDKRSKKKK